MEFRQYSFYDFIVKHSLQRPNKVFTENKDEAITFLEFRKLVAQTSLELSRCGITKGTYVSVHCVRNMRIVIIEAALFLLNAIAVLVPQLETPKAFLGKSTLDYLPHYYVEDKGDGLALYNKYGIQIFSFTFSPEEGVIDFADQLNKNADILAPCLMLFTSCSTGKSKAVLTCQKAILANYYGEKNIFGEKENDRMLSFLPLHHIFAFVGYVNAIVNGHYVYFMEKPHAYEMLEAIQEKKITITYAVPSIFLNLAKNQEARHYDVSTLRYGLISGAPASAEKMQWIEDTLGCPLLPVYGMTEALGITTSHIEESKENRWNTVGKVSPYNEIKIDTNGEILVKGESLMLGYAYRRNLIDPHVDENGFFHTGDLGEFDENGNLRILGRIKDIIIRGGENIAPKKIENALTSIHEIDQAAVVPAKDDFFGEIVCAAIIFKEGMSLTEAEIKEKLKLFLVKFEIPERYLFLKSFPLTFSQKVDKETLKKIFNGN